MTAYYSENDPKAAAWLRELIKRGHIAEGVVDERSIQDVQASDLMGYTQHHFFAGVGVWSYALRRAGWPDDRPVWTGSCPCQPFSAAGKHRGTDDVRHLWPDFFRLISVCRPRVVFGEQVASKDGLAWLDSVYADMEGAGYAIGAVDLCAAGFGAPHIRQRLYFVADAASGGQQCKSSFRSTIVLAETTKPLEQREQSGVDGPSLGPLADAESIRSGEGISNGRRRDERGGEEQGAVAVCGVDAGIMADADNEGPQGRRCAQLSECSSKRLVGQDGGARLVADADHGGSQERRAEREGARGNARDADLRSTPPELRGSCNGFWRDAIWIPCRDGKDRPIEPGTFPLVDGASSRVVRGGDSIASFDPDATAEARAMRLRGYGNAIVAPVAEAFVRAYMEAGG